MGQENVNAGGKKVPGKPKKTPKEIAAAKAAGKEKASNAEEVKKQTESDQAWVDTELANKSEGLKNEVFLQASKNCKETTYKNGKITLACPIPKKLIYCQDADPFTCDNGKVKNGKGCSLSAEASKSLNSKLNTKIDGTFISAEEGGSYLSPYVPWGPISKGKSGGLALTSRNNSGVTIGTGVDLGATNQAFLDKLKEAGVSQKTRDTLKPFQGLKRDEACKALRDYRKKNGPLVLPKEDVEKIDSVAFEIHAKEMKDEYKDAKTYMLLDYKNKIAKENKNKKPDANKIQAYQDKIDNLTKITKPRDFDSLTGAEQSILFSTKYHQGNITNEAIQPFVISVMGGDTAGEQTALENKSKASNSLIASRGKNELAYLKAAIETVKK